MGSLDFSLTYPSGRTLARADSAYDRNGYQGYMLGDKNGRCVQLTTFLPSCADCLKFWDLQPPGALRACPGLYRDSFTFMYERDSHNLTFPRLHPTSCSFTQIPIFLPPLFPTEIFCFLTGRRCFTSCNKFLFNIHVDTTWLFVDHEWESQRTVFLSVFNSPYFLGLRADFLSLGPLRHCRFFLTVVAVIYRIIRNDCRCCNNLSYTIHLRWEYVVAPRF